MIGTDLASREDLAPYREYHGRPAEAAWQVLELLSSKSRDAQGDGLDLE